MLALSRVQLTLFSDASESAVSSELFSFTNRRKKNMSALNVTTRDVGDVVIVDLDGRITIGESNLKLHEAIRVLVSEGKKKVLLNLEKVDRIDSSGLGEVVGAFSTLKKNDGILKLLKLTSHVQDLMTITKLLTVFDHFEDEASAIASFGSNPDLSAQPLETKNVRSDRAAGTIY